MPPPATHQTTTPEACTAATRDIPRVNLPLPSKRGEPVGNPRLLVKSLPGTVAAAVPPLTKAAKPKVEAAVATTDSEAPHAQDHETAGEGEEATEHNVTTTSAQLATEAKENRKMRWVARCC